MEEDDINSIIQRKIWTVDQLSLQANALSDKAKSIGDAKKNIPKYSGGWSEENVQKFFDRFRESIINPLRHKNRGLLENIGVQPKGISEEAFDDSLAITDIVNSFNKIKSFDENISSILIQKDVLLGWLREGLDKAKENLHEIIAYEIAFRRLDMTIDKALLDELLVRSVVDRGFITSAEEILSRITFCKEYGIATEYKESFDAFKSILEDVTKKLESLQIEYGIPKEEVSKLVNEKWLSDANEVLKTKLEESSEKKGILLDAWKIYSNTLKSLKQSVSEPPGGLQELEEGVKKLKIECINAIGEEGLSILAFLKGEETFPDKVSKDDIKKALEILRPLFIKFLKEGD